MNTELIKLQSTDGLELDGLMFEPHKKTDKIVIRVHGHGSNFYNSATVPTFAKTLTDNGYAMLSFNNRGTGTETYLKKDNKREVLGGSLNEIFEESIFDIEGAINFARGRGYNDITLLGYSYGCNKVTFYAINKGFTGQFILLVPVDMARSAVAENYDALLKDARALIAEGKGDQFISGYHWGRGVSAKTFVHTHGRDTNVDLFRYRDKTINNGVAALKNRVLIQIAGKDEYYDQPAAENLDYMKLAFANADLTTHIIPDANHSFTNHEQSVAQNITDWLLKKPRSGLGAGVTPA